MRAPRFRPSFDVMDRRITPSSATPTPSAEVAGGPNTVLQSGASSDLSPSGGLDGLTTLDNWMVADCPPIKEIDPAMPDLLPTDWFVADPR